MWIKVQEVRLGTGPMKHLEERGDVKLGRGRNNKECLSDQVTDVVNWDKPNGNL